MSDEWSRCPICFEDYSSLHRPTTFVCGHSTCIDHVVGFQQLRDCPICRHPLKNGSEYHVSYNLEEAARIFQLIKDKIDWSTITVSPVVNPNDPDRVKLDMVHRDEIYARQLQAELNRGNETGRRQTAQAAGINPVTQIVGRNPIAPTVSVTRPQGHMKPCGHSCDLVSTQRCCTCSDRRPHPPNGRYEAYADGRGIVDTAARNEFYCSTCKRR